MNLHVINTGFFKLDGGAMFGVVPKSMWQKTNPPDANNLCTWAMRCLLIEDGNKLILVDNGIGKKQDEKFLSHYHLHGDDSLEKSIQKLGFSFSDVTDMFLTHLHFDHCGGSIKYSDDRTNLELAFPEATYWSNEAHWQWATKPNPREKASFLKENIEPIRSSGQLQYIDFKQKSPFPNIEILTFDGHTEKQMLPAISYKDKKIVFMGDLLPSSSHIPLPYVMGYDTRPLITMDEKEKFLNQAADKGWILFFEHDPSVECCTLQHTEKGVRLKERFQLKEIL